MEITDYNLAIVKPCDYERKLKNNRTFLYFYKLIWLSDNCMRMQIIQILTQFLIMQNILGIFVYFSLLNIY